MRSKTIFAFFFLCIMTLSLVCLQSIKAQNNVYTKYSIDANGDIYPSTAPIQYVGNTYTLTANIRGSLIVGRSNIILDGNGYSIAGGQDELGIGGLIIHSLPISQPSTHVENILIKNFKVFGSVFGISLWQASNILIVNNSISGTGNGMLALDQDTAGIRLEGGSSNTIMGNALSNNYNGIVLYETKDNLIIENTIENSSNSLGISVCGIGLCEQVYNTTIYHNNFINNTQQVYVAKVSVPSPIVAIWDNGYPGGGNFWSDYKSRYSGAKMVDDTGIGNTSYVINSNNKDRFPLMESFAEFQTLTSSAPKISIISPSNQSYGESKVPLIFIIDKYPNWTAYSLDGNQNVTIIENATLNGLSDGSHYVVLYANDTLDNLGSSLSISFSIVTQPIASRQTFPTSFVVTASGVFAVAVCLSVIYYYKKRK